MKIRKQAAALAATVAVTAGTLAAEVPAAEAGTPWHIDVVECNGTGNQHEDFVQWENALWDACLARPGRGPGRVAHRARPHQQGHHALAGLELPGPVRHQRLGPGLRRR